MKAENTKERKREEKERKGGFGFGRWLQSSVLTGFGEHDLGNTGEQAHRRNRRAELRRMRRRTGRGAGKYLAAEFARIGRPENPPQKRS